MVPQTMTEHHPKDSRINIAFPCVPPYPQQIVAVVQTEPRLVTFVPCLRVHLMRRPQKAARTALCAGVRRGTIAGRRG